MEQQDNVPHYVLVSSSSRTRSATTAGSATTAVLGHPILQYHYANDSPLSLLPKSNDEHVLVLDYDPLNPALTRAQSVSGSSAVIGIKVTDAPGAGPAEGDTGWSNKMFVLETTTFDSRVPADESDPRVVLSQFKQNNVVIQQVLDYENTLMPLPTLSEAERPDARDS